MSYKPVLSGKGLYKKDAPFTNADETDPLSLHLDQSTPQTVINGAPVFNAGLRSNGAIILKSGQKLIFDGA